MLKEITPKYKGKHKQIKIERLRRFEGRKLSLVANARKGIPSPEEFSSLLHQILWGSSTCQRLGSQPK